MPYAPPRLFHTSADDGIIVISLQVMPYNSVFTIFIRRRSLLDIATKFSRTRAPASGTPPGDVVSIPWSEWGPPISRWLDTNQRDLTSSVAPTAVRWVLIDLSFGSLCDIAIYDFNPHNIYHAQEDLPGRYVIVGKGHTFDDEDFTEEFKMGLGCTVYEPPEKYDFDRVLVDEERMLGYKVRIWYGMVSRLSLLTLLAAERWRTYRKNYGIPFRLRVRLSYRCLCARHCYSFIFQLPVCWRNSPVYRASTRWDLCITLIAEWRYTCKYDKFSQNISP